MLTISFWSVKGSLEYYKDSLLVDPLTSKRTLVSSLGCRLRLTHVSA